MKPPEDRTRGARRNVVHRFARRHTLSVDDGWPQEPDEPAPLPTRLHLDLARSIISRNDSPDVPFSRSINPIAGCEHGCVYCYARPGHAYRDLSPGLDFETELFYKPDAARLLRQSFSARGYRPETIVIGASTDPYQPAERRLGLTRELLDVFLAYRHPVGIITKGGGILRDIDLLAELARLDLVRVMVSVTTLDDELKRIMEPRTASPATRLRVIRSLRQAGVPVGALVAPVIPFINDAEIERIVLAVAQAGADEVGHVLLRLPHELVELFEDWLDQHFPQRRARVMNAIRGMRGGRAYDSRFGQRMSGQGDMAQLLRQRFDVARRKAGLSRRVRPALRCDLFRIPGQPLQQELDL